MKNVVERFLIGGNPTGGASMPSQELQRALGTKIQIDITTKTLSVPVEHGYKRAVKGDTIICFDDGTFDVEYGV